MATKPMSIIPAPSSCSPSPDLLQSPVLDMPALMAPFSVLQYIGPNGAVHQCRLITNTDLHNVLACDSMLVNSNIAKDKIIARLRQHLIDQGASNLAEETDASFAEPTSMRYKGSRAATLLRRLLVCLIQLLILSTRAQSSSLASRRSTL